MSKGKKPTVKVLKLKRSVITGDVQVGGIAGEAINATTPVPGLRSALDKEAQMEQMVSWIQKFQKDPKKIPPIIIGSDLDGNVRVHTMKRKNGVWEMPNIKLWTPPSLLDKLRRRRKIRYIMKHLDPILKRDIGDVASLALERKSDEQLDSLHERLKRKNEREHIHITTRIGCVFIETGDESIQL